ncbi:competence protein ComK [Priestia abyssalis]|uniref:competence protein ComK n=1 Tax=Priestia abyssalis TaxID=1221450 RepID=UPI000995D16A|nr:competence protein ComK [Priestia abyssalis]
MIVDETRGICSDTMAVMYYPDTQYQTLILEVNGAYLTSTSPEKLIDEACLKHGSSYEGRRQAVIHVLQYWKRTPFPIAPLLGIYAFPSASSRDRDCVWLFLEHTLQFSPDPANHQHSIARFRNGKELGVKASARFLDTQYARTSACASKFGYLDLSPFKR